MCLLSGTQRTGPLGHRSTCVAWTFWVIARETLDNEFLKNESIGGRDVRRLEERGLARSATFESLRTAVDACLLDVADRP